MKIKKDKAQLPFRLNILFFIIFLLFSALILQLGVVQILEGAAYQEDIDRTVQDTTKIPVPRGKIYDRTHEVLVDNLPLYSITYTPPKGVQGEDKLEVAEKLIDYITVDEESVEKITERNKKEYWYLLSEENQEEVYDRLTDEDKEKLSDVEQYQKMLELITEDEISDFSEKELKIIAIKRELDKAFALTPQVIKNDGVTPEEYARVSEHLHLLPGINATTDWDRDYPFGKDLSTFLGTITTQEQGIPKEKEAYFLSHGYSRNDRVGRSGLEDYYEGILRGRKEQIQYTMDNRGNILDSKVIVPGERGKDLVLTIDMRFQESIDKIVVEELNNAINAHGQNRYLADYIDALVVVMDPKTGEVLALSGKHYNKEEQTIEDATHKTIYDAHRPGSAIKGATVSAGFQSGVVSPGTVIHDAPIKIQGTDPKSSYAPLGPVNDIDALERSSNIYMYQIAMRIGGEFNYYYDKKIAFNREGFDEMRGYFHQFGLGVETGLDVPYEATGYVGDALTANAGNLQDLAIGQFDTYTTMQLAQYISTIANDGYRTKPRFVREIREPNSTEDELGTIYQAKGPEILNRIDMSDEEISRIQEGLRRVFQGSRGTGVSHWRGKSYNPAGKTGTAENEVYISGRKIDTENLALVGYAPFDDPEVAFAVIVPNLGKVRGQYPINHRIGTRVLDAYFDFQGETTE